MTDKQKTEIPDSDTLIVSCFSPPQNADKTGGGTRRSSNLEEARRRIETIFSFEETLVDLERLTLGVNDKKRLKRAERKSNRSSCNQKVVKDQTCQAPNPIACQPSVSGCQGASK